MSTEEAERLIRYAVRMSNIPNKAAVNHAINLIVRQAIAVELQMEALLPIPPPEPPLPRYTTRWNGKDWEYLDNHKGAQSCP